jgi:hypothetical protein
LMVRGVRPLGLSFGSRYTVTACLRIGVGYAELCGCRTASIDRRTEYSIRLLPLDRATGRLLEGGVG